MGLADQFRKWRRNSHQPELTDEEMEPSTPLAAALLHQQTVTDDKKLRPKKQPKQYPPSPDSLLSGIGNYTFVKQVGQGKFSRVMLSVHTITQQQVAVKIIDKRVHDYRVMSRLVREIALMEALHHPNIVRLHETFETTDTLFLVLEYIDGFNLDEYLASKGGKLTEPEARLIFRQMVQAMDYCHSKWVVHRDLKAPNILLTKDLQVKIADFGLGNRFGRRRLKTICGSMLYYSPEIINGQGYTGPEVDCWCLGVSLYRMTVGEEPFSRANTVGDLRKDVTAGQYSIPTTLSQGLKNTIKKCMSVDKAKRTRVHVALKDDPWLFEDGALPNTIFSTQNSNVIVMSSSSGGGTKEERLKKEKERLKYQYLRDMEEEKRNKQSIHRAVICHPKNPSIYFTSHQVPHSPKPEEIYANSETQRHLLFQKLNELSHQLNLTSSTQNAVGKSPFKHLLRKLKSTENGLNASSSTSLLTNNQPSMIPPNRNSIVRKSNSNMSLSQLYQRVTKDQVHYYTFNYVQNSTPFTTVKEQDESVMAMILCAICDMMGITYHIDKPDHLTCVMSLSDYSMLPSEKSAFYKLKRRDSKMNNNVSYPSLNSSSSQASISQEIKSSALNSKLTSKLKRISHMLSSVFPYHSSTLVHQQSRFPSPSHASSSQNSIVDPTEEEEKKKGIALFGIEIISLTKQPSRRIAAIKLSKIEGSAKVFRIACGWLTGVMEQNMLVDQFMSSSADIPPIMSSRPSSMMVPPPVPALDVYK